MLPTITMTTSAEPGNQTAQMGKSKRALLETAKPVAGLQQEAAKPPSTGTAEGDTDCPPDDITREEEAFMLLALLDYEESATKAEETPGGGQQ